MVWCVASPFFIGSISKGRTIRQTVLGGYLWGLAGTFTSFIVLGNYGLALQMKGKLDVLAIYNAAGDLYPGYPGHYGNPAPSGPGADTPGADP